MNLEKNLLIAIRAAIDAGKEIIDIYHSDYTIESKADLSPLTTADLRSHEVITGQLAKTGIPELSEEGKHLPYARRASWTSVWIVDPLDGTKEFIKRNGEFTVNIALVHKQEPLMGVIYIPVTAELYFSMKGAGAYKVSINNDTNNSLYDMNLLTGISKKLPFDQAGRHFTVVCSRSHMNTDTQVFVDTLKINHPRIEYASRGSSLKFCLIAEGVADIYPRFAPTMEWDTAAGQAIVEESGGRVIRNDNRERLLYNKENLLNPWFIASR